MGTGAGICRAIVTVIRRGQQNKQQQQQQQQRMKRKETISLNVESCNFLLFNLRFKFIHFKSLSSCNIFEIVRILYEKKKPFDLVYLLNICKDLPKIAID